MPRCNYGRACGVLTAAGKDVGAILISERGLARRYVRSDIVPARGTLVQSDSLGGREGLNTQRPCQSGYDANDRQCHAKRIRNSSHHQEAWVSLVSLNSTYVGRIYFRFERQLF